MSSPLLSIKNLRVEFSTQDGIVPVIDDLSFDLQQGETIGLVGESGCGKSMTALAIMNLLPQPIANIANGSIVFAGEDLTQASQERMQSIRGNEIAMIFQEPMTSMNPVYTVGEQVAEVLRRHFAMKRKAAWQRACELLDLVKIPNPMIVAKKYPHQLSGGQLQRVMIAIALACEPKIIIADEPTTALDVTVQGEIFELLVELRRKISTSIIFITHDMGAVAELSARMIVMYAGRKIEEGSVADVLHYPQHPYTQGLISCVPHICDSISTLEPLAEISGIVPSITEFGKDACLFMPRCQYATQQCGLKAPCAYTITAKSNHVVHCWHAQKQLS